MKTKKTAPYEKAILSAKKEFISIAGKSQWEMQSRSAIVRMNADTSLHGCDPESIKQAVINIALTGVSVSPIHQEAYFIARDGKCFLDFTYRGLIGIATSEGAIVSMNAGVVYSWDKLKYKEGTNAFLDHVKNLNPPIDPDEIARNPKRIWEYLTAAYSIVTFPNGTQDFVLMPKFKLVKTWNNTAKTAINEMWPEEWIRKTAIRYHAKSLPRAAKLVTATMILNEHEGLKKEKKKTESEFMKMVGEKSRNKQLNQDYSKRAK